MPVGRGPRRDIRGTEIRVGRMRIPRGQYYRLRVRDSIARPDGKRPYFSYWSLMQLRRF
jgi:hypothetical protein